jgi:hypothetical protein
MGREATVHCQWGEEAATCRVLLESQELIVRGDLRRRVPLSSLADVRVERDQLRFRAGQEVVSLQLGTQLAERWAKAIATPPPSLAKKLGISSASRLRIIGAVASAELEAAIAEAATTDGKNTDLIVAQTESRADLVRALGQVPRDRSCPPIWIVYPKGAGKELDETFVREAFRGAGFIDTKVASVSARLTALRFILKSHERP